ncbi:MAG: VOC family protein [Anaerolineae bacterium]
MSNAVNWFEIPAADFDRAAHFYDTILDASLHRELFGGIQHAIFSSAREGAGGAIIYNPEVAPSSSGTVVYLNAAGKLDAVISRVEKAGGKVLMPSTHIGDPGYIAIIQDTEGNKVGLHSPD